MSLDPKDYAPGTVVIPCNTLSRYSVFQHSLSRLSVPPGTAIMHGVGDSISGNINRGIRTLGPEEHWVWIMNDDHQFNGKTLLKLLARDLPIVGPLNLQRVAPHNPVLYAERLGPCEHRRLSWPDIAGKTGLFEVSALGGAGMLIKREVLDKIGDPWFYDYVGPPEAYMDPKKRRFSPNEDMCFSERVVDLGYKLFVDLDVLMGHTTACTFSPVRMLDGTWEVAYENS